MRFALAADVLKFLGPGAVYSKEVEALCDVQAGRSRSFAVVDVNAAQHFFQIVEFEWF